MNHYEQISAALADQDLDAILLTRDRKSVV